MMNLWEEKPEKHVSFERWDTAYIQVQNKNILFEENDCMHTLVPVGL